MPQYLYVMNNFETILLIFARIIGAIYLIPIFSGKNVPRNVKISFSFIIAVLIFSTGIVNFANFNDSAVGYVFLITKELITGIILSFVVFLFFSIFYFAGQLLDYQLGYSMVSVFDPLTQIQAPVTGNLIYYVSTILLIQSGGLNAVLLAMFDSYETIPIGAINLVGNEGIATYFILLSANFLEIGIKIAAPITGTIILIDVSLGILVKTVPQMNVFVVGMPIKVLIGMTLFLIISPYISPVFHSIFTQMFLALKDVMTGVVLK